MSNLGNPLAESCKGRFAPQRGVELLGALQAAESIATASASTSRITDSVGPLLLFVTAVKLVSVCIPPSSY